MAKASGLQKITLTYEDYLHLPDDGKRYEIIEGELFVTPAPITKHQIFCTAMCVSISKKRQHIIKARRT